MEDSPVIQAHFLFQSYLMLSGLHREHRLDLAAAMAPDKPLQDVEMLVLCPKSTHDNPRGDNYGELQPPCHSNPFILQHLGTTKAVGCAGSFVSAAALISVPILMLFRIQGLKDAGHLFKNIFTWAPPTILDQSVFRAQGFSFCTAGQCPIISRRVFGN